MDRRNIVLVSGTGVYGAVRKYINEFAAAFRELGYNTAVLDGNLKSFQQKHQYLLEHYPVYAVVDCQAMIVEVLPGYQYDKSIAKVHYFCDHPLYLHERLGRLDGNDILLNVDERHTGYLRKYYPGFTHTAYVPLSGNGADILRPYREREIEVLFTGSYWVPQIPVLPSAEMGFADSVKWKVQEKITKNPYLTIEDALEQVFGEYQIEVSREEFAQILNEIRDVEFYAREFYRDRMIRTLLAAGVDVSVYGEGWEKLQCPGMEHLHILRGGAEVARRALGNAKIALNIMPGFKAGFQERIAAAMLSGAVAVTDVSSYLEETFTDGREMVFYRLDQLEKLPVIIRELLADEARCMRIADAGMRVAKSQHTWRRRVLQMAEQIETYHGNTFVPGDGIGCELTVPEDVQRASYVVEEVGVCLSEELSRLNDLNNCGYASYEDAHQLLEDLRSWNEQLAKLCGHRFFSGNNLEVFIASCELMLKQKDRFAEAMRQLLLVADSILCGIREKYEAVTVEEFAMGAGSGENCRLYDKMAARFLYEKYKDCTEKTIETWLRSLAAGAQLRTYPMQMIDKYTKSPVDLQYDEACDMFYVIHCGKPLYYPQEFSPEQIIERYRIRCMERDPESAHRYLDEMFGVQEGATVMDAGAADGSFALEVIDRVKKVYLVEREDKWFPAWEQTFAPYREKVVFLHKVLGSRSDGICSTIDEIAENHPIDFLKMDIGGAEADALHGAERTLCRNGAMKCVIAAYHVHGMEDQIKEILKTKGFAVSDVKGYLFHKDYEKPLWENELRHALVRAERN